jgi:hypothetical protein
MSAKVHTGPAQRAFKGIAAGLALAVASYAGYAGLTWLRYGGRARRTPDEEDALLDRFMPKYEISERHHIEVAASPEVTFAAAAQQELTRSAVVRAIVKAREIVLGAEPDQRPRPHGLMADMQALGWGILAEVPGREVVMGAFTRPWEANPVFQPLPPWEFSAFSHPGYVKIAWTLRADPVDSGRSIFRTETRAVTTDAVARRRFRRYWALVSPGVVLIRRSFLPLVKKEAERRAGKTPVALAG